MKIILLISFLKRSNKKTMPNLVSGSSLVEILVAVFVFTIVLGSLITASNMYLSGAGESLRSAKGAYLAQEGIEGVKLMRDAAWTNISSLSTDTNYYLTWNTASSTWKATTTVSIIDSIFVRNFRLYPVYRDTNTGDATTSVIGWTLDPNTKMAKVTVSWKNKNSTTTKYLSTYIADIL